MWNPVLIIACASWMLAGCASPVPRMVEPIPRAAPVNLLQACPEPPEPQASLGELLKVYVETVSLYRQCQARHNALIQWTANDGRD